MRRHRRHCRPDRALISDPAPPVIAVIVSWNTERLLGACLDSLRADSDEGVASVLVADNASVDDSVAMVRERRPWARVLPLGENRGFGAAVNAALAAEGGPASPWLFIGNADIELRPGALRRLLDAGERDSGLGLAAPRLLRPDGSTQRSAFPLPSLRRQQLRAAARAPFGAIAGGRPADAAAEDPDHPREIGWALGAALLLRRRAFDAVGGFDERQWMYLEDTDIGWRLARAGWRARYVPEARVLHVAAAATEQAFGPDPDDRVKRAYYDWLWRRRGPLHYGAALALDLLIAVEGWAWHGIRGLLARPGAALARAEWAGRIRAELDAARAGRRSGNRP